MRAMNVMAFVVAGGAAACAFADVNTRLEYQVSLDGVSWASTVNALPGTEVQVRARLSFVGADPVYGLRELAFQPVIKGWTAQDALVTTPGTPLNRGIGPLGSNTTTPSGAVPDLPGVYGRVYPFAAVGRRQNDYTRGHLGTGENAGMMRIAQNHITNWIGVGSLGSANNRNGHGGVTVGQFHPLLSPANSPAFVTDLSDLVVFKFGFIVGGEERTMSISTPQEGTTHSYTGGVLVPACSWWSNPNSYDTTAINRGGAEIFGAEVQVISAIPAPAGVAVLACGVLLGTRRRRGGCGAHSRMNDATSRAVKRSVSSPM